ncbi:MAG: LysE family transporter [Cytophagaceae bacterium]|nr:LysE family transporter [Cytophagaceae bacterium]
MLYPLLSGIGAGLILTILPGTVFFGLIQTSIQKGFKYGGMYALGVACSDLLCILLSYYVISGVLENKVFQNVVAISGGVLMCIFGMFYFFKPSEKTVPLNPMQEETRKGNFILKGFLLNIFNPVVLFYWVGLVSIVSVKYDNKQILVFTFFAALVLTILMVDILKSYIANRIKYFFTNKRMTALNKILGILFFSGGVKLMFDAYVGNSFF